MRGRKLFAGLGIVSLLLMIPMIARAIAVRGVFDNAQLMEDVWFQVTLLDAYLAFLAVWAFVCVTERSNLARFVWLLSFLCLGSVGIAAYFLMLARRDKGLLAVQESGAAR